MTYWLILFPMALAAAAFAFPSNRWRPWLLPLGGLGQLALVAAAMARTQGPGAISGLGGWLQLDALGKVFLGFISVLFFLCSLYAPGYLALRPERSNRVLCTNLLLVLSMMS